MDPIQAKRNTSRSVGAGPRAFAESLLVSVGALVLTLTMEPATVFGENPEGDIFAMPRSSNSSAATRRDSFVPTAVEGDVSRELQLHTSGPLPMRTARNLVTGHSLALERVREDPACSALFSNFAASGVEKMARTFYVAPSAVERREFCVGGVTAFTQVGSRVTRLCPAFGDMDRRNAALTLIHEALHSAGMPESPSTDGAMTPGEINDLVGTACGL